MLAGKLTVNFKEILKGVSVAATAKATAGNPSGNSVGLYQTKV